MAILKFEGRHSFLSNFESDPILLDGKIYQTLEHAYQAAKTLDPVEREAIAACSTAGKAKRHGLRVTLRKDWEDIKVDIMYVLLRKKFSEEPYKTLLLETNDEHLEEGNWWGDCYWGVSPAGSGIGENVLGKLLMEVRDDIKRDRAARRRWYDISGHVIYTD